MPLPSGKHSKLVKEHVVRQCPRELMYDLQLKGILRCKSTRNSKTRMQYFRSPFLAVSTLGLQIAQQRAHLCTLGPKVGTIYILGALGLKASENLYSPFLADPRLDFSVSNFASPAVSGFAKPVSHLQLQVVGQALRLLSRKLATARLEFLLL